MGPFAWSEIGSPGVQGTGDQLSWVERIANSILVMLAMLVLFTWWRAGEDYQRLSVCASSA